MAITKPIQVEVVRKKWYRGHGANDSYLYIQSTDADNKKMCCIGFLARVLGCRIGDIANVSCLIDVAIEKPMVEDFAHQHDSILTDCYEVNDQEHISESVRERKLTALGKKMGVQFTFVD